MKSSPIPSVEPASRAAANSHSESSKGRSTPSEYVDMRPETLAQRRFIDQVNQSAAARQTVQRAHHDRKPVLAPTQETNAAQLRLVRYNRQDNQLDAYLNALDGLLQAAATWALNVDNMSIGGSGYYTRWEDLATEYKDNEVNSPFLAAAYGYAVETRTNDTLDSIAGNLPAGWTVDKQVSKGMTRPDIIVSDNLGQEVAWLDMTSDSVHSVGHVKKKAGGGWSTKPYVYEIVYPPLDKDLISQSNAPWQAAKVRAAKNRNIQARDSAVTALEYSLIGILVKNQLSRDSSPADAMKAFVARFPDEQFTHDKIRSIIEMGRGDIRDYGYRLKSQQSGRNKAAAESFLVREFY